MTTRSSLMREDDRTGVSETRPDRQYRMPPCPIHSQFRGVGHDLGGTTHRTCPLSDFEPRPTWLKGATWEIPVENVAAVEIALVVEDSMGWIVIHFSEWCRNTSVRLKIE